MVEEWSRAITTSRADSHANILLLPYGTLFDQRRYPKSYSIPFLFLLDHGLMCKHDSEEAKKPEYLFIEDDHSCISAAR